MLAQLEFPAAVWQLVAHAQSWGAPNDYVQRLSHLPAVTYRDHREVLAALGLAASGGSPSPVGDARRVRRWEDLHTTLPSSDML